MKNRSLITTILTHIEKEELITPGSTVICGLSGGPDSMFLLHVLAQLHQQGTITLIAAHLDHGWRPTSEQDAQFCDNACNALGIACRTEKLQSLCLTTKFNGSKEELGRKARRFFFEKIAHEETAAHIALAHHADDQQETFFLRLMRGATLTGLTGIKQKNGLYIRPLLTIKKTDILSYLHAHNIAYLTDETNTHPDFLRNRIRTQALPVLKACDDRFDKNFAATIKRLQETEELLDQLTNTVLQSISTEDNGTVYIDRAAFEQAPRTLQQRIILAWLCKEQVPFVPSEGFLDELLRFLSQPHDGTHTLHSSWALHKKRGLAHIEK